MDRSRPINEEEQTSSSAEDQVSDEACEESSSTSQDLARQLQNRIDFIKTKASTGLKKLRGSLNARRREDGGEAKSKADTEEPSQLKIANGYHKQRTQPEDQTQEQSENLTGKGLSSDSQAPQHLPEASQSRPEIVKEPQCESLPSVPLTNEVQTPVSITTALRVIGKPPAVPQEYTPQTEVLASSATFASINLPPSSKKTLPPRPPTVPFRPSKEVTNAVQSQPAASGRQVTKETGWVMANSITQEVAFSQANHADPPPSSSSERVAIARDGASFSTVYQKDSNTGMQRVEIDSQARKRQDMVDDPRTCKNVEAPHYVSGAASMMQTAEVNKRSEQEKVAHTEFVASPSANHQKQKQMKCLSFNAADEAYSELPPPRPTENVKWGQSSPPVLSVHNTYKRVEPPQRRIAEAVLSDARVDGACMLPTPSGTVQEKTLLSPKIESVVGKERSALPKFADSNSTKTPQQTQPTLEPSPRSATACEIPDHLQISQKREIAIPKPNSPSPNAATEDETIIAEQPKSLAVSHHITPNRPAPKPPSVRSTIVQYPGPIKGYTVSGARWAEAQPPPLPPPPVPPLRPSAPPAPVPPPRYMYYDNTEPCPYMPTTEPLPHKTAGGMPFLNSILNGWKGNIHRKDGSPNEHGGSSATLGLGGLVSNSSWKSSWVRNSMRRQFSSLSTSAGPHDSPGSPVDQKRSKTVWLYMNSKANRFEDSIGEEDREARTNMTDVFGDNVYTILLIHMACCCCWPVGLASWVLDSTLPQGRGEHAEACIHTMAQQQSWFTLLVGMATYFFLMVFIISLFTVGAGGS